VNAPDGPESRRYQPSGVELVLASASPRRHSLLAGAGLRFQIQPADVDETINAELTAGEAARDLALRKARAVAARRAAGEAPAIVLGSDTLVVLGEDGGADRRFLEKAGDAAEARQMLGALSGTRHRVITGVAAVRTEDGAERSDHETTWVTMRPISASEIDAYVESGEWRGKAGAYAIQESADRFVVELEGGGFDNVVGLPVARTLKLLSGL
jgi:septum formation protein